MTATYPETSPPETRQVSAAPRLDFLDALRGIAAALVVIQHVGERYTSWIPQFCEAWFNFGRFGVTIFFLVSGFVIPYAFEKDSSVRAFWIKRIFRLYPLYWLSLALTMAAHIEPADFLQSRHLIRDEIVNVTMLQGFVGIPNASAPYWTLFIEMAFYLAFTGWFLLQLHKKTMLWAWIGAAGFFCISILAPVLRGLHAPVTKVFCFLAILVGSALYRNYKRQAAASWIAALIAVVVLLAAGGAYLNFFKFPSSEHVSATAVFLSWTSALLVFCLLFAMRRKRFPAFFLWLGKISYSLYLLHAIVVDVMPDFGNKPFAFVLVLLISLGVSSISFRYFERHFVSLGHRIAAKSELAHLVRAGCN